MNKVLLCLSTLLVGCSMAPTQQRVLQPVVLKPVLIKHTPPDNDVIGRWLESNRVLEPRVIEGEPLLNTLYQHYATWQGVRYQPGGMSMQGVDCSGFAKLTFAELFRIELPRNTSDQAQRGQDVMPSELRSGDLVFFRIDKRTQHVGIYLEDDKFLHASTSNGVEIANINDRYWRTRYWKSVRIPEL